MCHRAAAPVCVFILYPFTVLTPRICCSNKDAVIVVVAVAVDGVEIVDREKRLTEENNRGRSNEMSDIFLILLSLRQIKQLLYWAVYIIRSLVYAPNIFLSERLCSFHARYFG